MIKKLLTVFLIVFYLYILHFYSPTTLAQYVPFVNSLRASTGCYGNQNAVLVTWGALQRSYYILRDGGYGARWQQIGDTNGGSFTDTGAATGIIYTYVLSPGLPTFSSNRVTITGPDCSGGGPPPATPPPPPPATPQFFHQHQPVPYCAGPGNLAVNLNWDPSSNATEYFVYFFDGSGGGTQGGWSVGGATSTTVGPGNGLQPNHVYAFIIRAANSSGETYSDNSTWSVDMYGYTTAPDCSPPGAFNMSSAPAASCPVANAPGQISLNWGGSSGATIYEPFYRTGGSGSGSSLGTTTALQRIISSPPLSAGQSYGFLVGAYKSAGSPYVTYSNGGTWTDSIYGATLFPNCAPPTVTMTLTNTITNQQVQSGGGIPLPVKQTEPVRIAWTSTNASSCTASYTAPAGAPAQDTSNLNSVWTGSKATQGTAPSNLVLIGLGNYQLALSCLGTNGFTGQTTVNINVQQLEKPFIQTTGGDIHTNESINIPKN